MGETLYRPPLPPGPNWTNIGVALRASPPIYLLNLFKKYGEIARFKGAFTVYAINNPDCVKNILTSAWPQYSKNTIDYKVISTVFGNGLVTSDGNDWARQRRIMQPVFSSRSVNSFDKIINDTTAALADNWSTKNIDDPIWLDRDMSKITFQVVSRTLFGTNIDHVSDEMIDILDLLNIHPMRLSALLRLFPWIPSPSNKRFLRANRRLDEIVYALIEEHRAPDACQENIVGRLLAAKDEDSKASLTAEQIRDEVVTLMLAGHETSAVSLTWTFYLLSQYPEIEERLCEELETKLNGAPATSSDLAELTYLKQVVQESLRLYPAVWGIARRSLDEVTLGGYCIPENSYIAITPYVLHRDPKHWPEPEKFDPERFSPGQIKSRHSYSYLPFGAGPRTCIGAGMAMLEIQLILAQLLQRFKVTPITDQRIEVEAAVTLKPRYGLKVCLEPRIK